MIMDPKISGFSDYVNGFQAEDSSGQNLVFPNGFDFRIPSPDFSSIDVQFFAPSLEPAIAPPSVSVSPPIGDSDSSDLVLKYISQMLMEENMEDEPFNDTFALQNTEKSLYEVLGKQYPAPVIRPEFSLDHNVEGLDSDIYGNSNGYGSNFCSSTSPSTSSQSFVKNVLSDEESILQFKRGFEEASKFLPSGDKLVIDLDNNTFSGNRNTGISKEKQQLCNGFRSRKHNEREGMDLAEERNIEQPACYVDENELSEMFDKVMQCNCKDEGTEAVLDGGGKNIQKNGHCNESDGVETSSYRRGTKRKTIDLSNLLSLCAQAVSSYDHRTAGELIKQIREHSSPLGDGSQRLAHYFVSGLEARLEGSGTQNFFLSLTFKKITVADALKAHKVYLSACPFEMLAICFSNKMISHMAERKTTLHVIDFGILFGFQWPLLIQNLSTRPGGPPKLRITGIELPQIGFRPTERVEETGRRLAKYCERFNVPFEYKSIAVQNWETIQLEDLKIDKNEMLAVNNLFRFENLIDEMAEVDCECPRDAVLKLIRRMNPDIFVQSVCSGSYNSPYFVRRFKEALFHFSAIYDALDATKPREDPGRLLLENEFYGREAKNVIACEGLERVHRPETYKQWQFRTLRTGFKPLPLDQELMQILRNKMKTDYHEDFLIDENKHWMLFASSCWIPA